VTVLRKVELISGVATGLLALFGPSSFSLAVFMYSDFTVKEKTLGLLSLFVTYIGPAILIAIGSYIHAVRQRVSGLVMVLVGLLILTIIEFVVFVGGFFYALGTWSSAVTLLPWASAIVTMIAALLARAAESRGSDVLDRSNVYAKRRRKIPRSQSKNRER
jgi:hypothetical protein